MNIASIKDEEVEHINYEDKLSLKGFEKEKKNSRERKVNSSKSKNFLS